MDTIKDKTCGWVFQFAGLETSETSTIWKIPEKERKWMELQWNTAQYALHTQKGFINKVGIF